MLLGGKVYVQMKIYDLIKQLLTIDPKLRDSDHLLIWDIWKLEGRVVVVSGQEYITKERYMDSTHFESIRRTRQKVQEHFPALQSSPAVLAKKHIKQKEKGTFVFREKVPVFDIENRTVHFEDR